MTNEELESALRDALTDNIHIVLDAEGKIRLVSGGTRMAVSASLRPTKGCGLVRRWLKCRRRACGS